MTDLNIFEHYMPRNSTSKSNGLRIGPCADPETTKYSRALCNSVCILVKVSKIHFLVENVFCFRKKMFTIICRFNVTVTSLSDVPIFSLFKA